MPEGEFNFDDSDLQVGIEFEYPAAPGWSEEEKYTTYGRRTRSEADTIRREERGWTHGGSAGWDGTVGIEITSPVLDAADGWKWYADTKDRVENEYGIPLAPTGLMESSTAGLHIHLSPISRDEAKALYELSTTSWAKAFFCSSIVSENGTNQWPVFRSGNRPPDSGYCRFEGWDSTNHYNCTNQRRGDHWEWRLPEPMSVDNFEHVMEFLVRFHEDIELGVQYAQEVLDSGTNEITSIKRAEMVGMEFDDDAEIARAPAPESAEFYEHVEERPWLPEIHRVGMDGRTFYLFDTRLQGTFEAGGVQFDHDDVLNARTLEPVDDALEGEIRSAYRSYGEQTNRTPATDYVKDVVKKKKA